MIAADIGRAALVLLVPLAAWRGLLRIELLLPIAFLVVTLGVAFEIASQSCLPVILPTGDLPEGNARLHTGWGIAEIGGPGLAGWLTQRFSAPVAILIDGLSYGVSAMFLAGIRVTEIPLASEGRAQQHFWRDLAEGPRLVASHPMLRATAIATGLWNLFDGARWAVLVLFLTRTLTLDASAAGIIFTAGAIGYLLGSFLPDRVARRAGLGRAILLGIVLAAPTELLTALAAGPPLMAAAIAGARGDGLGP